LIQFFQLILKEPVMPPQRLPFRKSVIAISPALFCTWALVACGGGSDTPSPAANSAANPTVANASDAASTSTVAPTPVPSTTTEPTAAAVVAPTARVGSIELAQSLLFPSGDIALVLVVNKDVLVKVNVTNSNTTEAKPTGNLRVETTSGQLLQTIALTAPTGALPTAIPQVPSFTNAYTAVVPGNLVKSGLRLTVAMDNQQSPTTINPRVGGGIAMELVAVPVQIGGVTGQVVPGAASYVQARMPVSSVTLRTRTPYVPKGVTSLPGSETAWRSAFSTILNELDDLHTLERAPKESYYYGFLPKRTFGLAGLGYIPGNAALGFDVPTSPEAVRETMTHELGHNTSLPHAPCGGPARPDPQYPYANAQLGAPGRYIWGYNQDTKAFTDPRRTDIHDIMSYCDGATFSDYNYRKIQVHLTPGDKLVKTTGASGTAAAPQELLLISGQIEAGKAELRPLKTMLGEANVSTEGPYTLRITTAQGNTVDYKFATKQIDHMPATQRFSLTIPHPGAVTSMAVVKDGATLMQSAAKVTGNTANNAKGTAENVKAQVQVSEQGGMAKLTWDSARYPYLTVTYANGAQRSTMAQDLEGGTASLPMANVPAGGGFEFSLSDGLNTQRLTHSR
jgi:Peptidase M66